MAVKPIPDGYHSVQPYLIVHDAASAIDFYKAAFGATERLRMTQKDGSIGHAELQLGDSCIMLADENAQIDAFCPTHYGGSPITLLIYTGNCDAMYRSAIAAGAKSVRQPTDQFYGDRMAGIQDPSGHTWFIATHIQDVSREELEKSR